MTEQTMAAASLMEAFPTGEKRARYGLIDCLRGITIVSMILYHATWDLVHLWGFPWAWFESLPAYVWQQSICWTFILLSGFCWPLGKRGPRRPLTVLAAGLAVSVVTVAFVPEQRIQYGILTLLGSCMLLFLPLKRVLAKIPPFPGLAASLLLFILLRDIGSGHIGLGPWGLWLPDWLYQGQLAAFVGFMPRGFHSTDYFPLLPWMFLFLAGIFLHDMLRKRGERLLSAKGLPLLNWLGRRSLLIYLAHQPLISLGLAGAFFLYKHLEGAAFPPAG